MARKLKTMDGNTAAANVSYAFTEVAAIYPITPSTVMAEVTDEMAAKGVKNIFGQPVKLAELEHEGGAAGAVHGSAMAGALTTTYTASQGLLLMVPNMYKIAGERLPAVFHVAARCVSQHSLSIFGDHSDAYACRQTGVAMLCTSSVQEIMDLGAVAHLAAVKGRLPVLHFFDGFRTSHEIQKIECWDYDELAEMLDWDALNAFRRGALNPEHPDQRGTAQNSDTWFQNREACNTAYNDFVQVAEDYMHEVNRRIGTNYELFNYYGAEDAEQVIVAMGSVCGTIKEAVDYLNKNGAKVGLIQVHLYRPFSAKHLIDALPDTVKTISVIDRTKEPGSIGEPLYLDVCAALSGSKFNGISIYRGRYALAGKDTTPAHIIPVYENMKAEAPKEEFTLAIIDDVTNLSLPVSDVKDTVPAGTYSCKFWGLGSDGTVGANKNSIKIIGDNTDKKVQAYFAYDSKKSGGVTVSHLRFGDQAIDSAYLINSADFVACHNEAYIKKYDIVQDVKDGGVFLLNCQWDTIDELDKNIPAAVKKYIHDHNINFYTINASAIAIDVGLGNRVSTILQSSFFNLTQIIPGEDALKLMKDAATKSFSRKGEEIVRMNHEAIERGFSAAVKVDVPDSWATPNEIEIESVVSIKDPELKKFYDTIMVPANSQRGDSIPVSAYMDYIDGVQPSGSAALEKRGVALFVPEWDPEKCIQCNQCAYVCPHAVIRPVVLTAEELEAAPASTKTADLKGLAGYKYSIAVSPYDCTGCGSCVTICPAGAKDPANKAITMKPFEGQKVQHFAFEYGTSLPEKAEVLEKFKPSTVKGSQFRKPLFEFSGACGGCGETPYMKLLTQVCGDRMYMANATGCSSIWGNSAPSTPFTKNDEGKGPAWGNSLFEDNAEFGYGMYLANIQIRLRLKEDIEKVSAVADGALKEACDAWLETYNNPEANAAPAKALKAALEAAEIADADADAAAKDALNDSDYLAKKSQWLFGGDGWAYDIGFGGLDHVLAQNENLNIIVADTEVYSNTGGQASKATPAAAVAKLAAAGKVVKKKDLGQIAMSYGYIYVAQIAMGADYNQTLKAIREAEAYDGPSLIIAYAPCINHGIKGGLAKAMVEEKRAVEAGYWQLYRYNPALVAEGKNPLTIDSKEPTADYKEFLEGEVRYSSLKRSFPEKADVLYDKSADDAKAKFEHLQKLVKLYEPEQ